MDKKPSKKDESGSSTKLGGPRGDDGAKAMNGGTGGTGGANPPIGDGGPPRGGGGKPKQRPHQG